MDPNHLGNYSLGVKSNDIKLEEIDELFNESTEPTPQNHLPIVQIIREDAEPDEIVKEEPEFYHEYDLIETESRDFESKAEGQSKQSQFKKSTQTKQKRRDDERKNPNLLPGAMFECYMCNAEISSASNLKRHNDRFHGIKTFKCNICSKRFSVKFSLDIHERSHTGSKPFECKICLRTFATQNNLRRHNESCRPLKGSSSTKKTSKELPDENRHFENKSSENTGSKNKIFLKMYSCNICRKQFFHQSNLVKHMQKHTTKKPFECETCSNKFTTKRNLKRHKRLHTREGLFLCSYCSKEYTTKYARDAHEKKHK